MEKRKATENESTANPANMYIYKIVIITDNTLIKCKKNNDKLHSLAQVTPWRGKYTSPRRTNIPRRCETQVGTK